MGLRMIYGLGLFANYWSDGFIHASHACLKRTCRTAQKYAGWVTEHMLLQQTQLESAEATKAIKVQMYFVHRPGNNTLQVCQCVSVCVGGSRWLADVEHASWVIRKRG